MSIPQNRIITLTAKGCTAADETGHLLGCITCGARAITQLPEGFVAVQVLLTDAEADAMRGDVLLTQRMTYSEAIRQNYLGLSPSPYGIYAAIARMNGTTKTELDQEES